MPGLVVVVELGFGSSNTQAVPLDGDDETARAALLAAIDAAIAHLRAGAERVSIVVHQRAEGGR